MKTIKLIFKKLDNLSEIRLDIVHLGWMVCILLFVGLFSFLVHTSTRDQNANPAKKITVNAISKN